MTPENGRSRRQHREGWLAAAVALVVAGCSSASPSNKKAAAPPPSTATSAPAPATTGGAAATTTVPSPSLAAVSGDVLKPADLPPGWQATPSNQSSGADPSNDQLTTCVGLTPSPQKSPSANSDDFTLVVAGGGQQVISNHIVVGSDAAHDVQQFTALQGPHGPACINHLITTALGQQVSSGAPGAKVSGVTTTAVSLGTYLDRTVAFRTTATITAADQSGPQTIPVSFDLVLFQRGRYTAEFSFVGIKAPIDPGVEKPALSAVAARMGPLSAT